MVGQQAGQGSGARSPQHHMLITVGLSTFSVGRNWSTQTKLMTLGGALTHALSHDCWVHSH